MIFAFAISLLYAAFWALVRLAANETRQLKASSSISRLFSAAQSSFSQSSAQRS
jgi:hypothetical protein